MTERTPRVVLKDVSISGSQDSAAILGAIENAVGAAAADARTSTADLETAIAKAVADQRRSGPGSAQRGIVKGATPGTEDLS